MTEKSTTDVTVAARALPIWNGVVKNSCFGLTDSMLADVARYALALGTMTDDELFVECQSAIYGSALMANYRRPTDVHAKCDLCFAEASRRDPRDETQDPVHPGAGIYSRAHAAVMRSQGYEP